MVFSLSKAPHTPSAEAVSSLARVVQLLLEGHALHAVEIDSSDRSDFQTSIRDIAARVEKVEDPKDFLVLAGETNKTVQTYNHAVEKSIQALSNEKQLSVDLLTQSFLRVCKASENSAQTLRGIERALSKASQIQDLRELRAKLADCVSTLCLEAEAHEAQYSELKERLANTTTITDIADEVTGLKTFKSAEACIKEMGEAGKNGYVKIFFLKNVDLVNRRFGYAAGNVVMKRFATYLGKNLRGKEQLFRWRGTCFVVIVDRLSSLEEIQAEAHKIGSRGPEEEVESGGKSMLMRLTAATTAMPIPKGHASNISEKIDQFASEQFKISPAAN